MAPPRINRTAEDAAITAQLQDIPVCRFIISGHVDKMLPVKISRAEASFNPFDLA
jgi:hypothetical protein